MIDDGGLVDYIFLGLIIGIDCFVVFKGVLNFEVVMKLIVVMIILECEVKLIDFIVYGLVNFVVYEGGLIVDIKLK